MPGLVKTVGNRPTGSSKEIEPPLGGTNPDTRKSQAKEELKDNQKQKYQPIDQNFKQTNKETTNTTLKGKTCHAVSLADRTVSIRPARAAE